MEREEVLDCVVHQRDENGLQVRCGRWIGVVDNNEVAWRAEDNPRLGDRVKVVVRFPTPYANVSFDFVGSIKDARPETHPIHSFDDSAIGVRFSSRILACGQWWALKHPTGVMALLPRESLDRTTHGNGDLVEVEVAEIDRERKQFVVRLPNN